MSYLPGRFPRGSKRRRRLERPDAGLPSAAPARKRTYTASTMLARVSLRSMTPESKAARKDCAIPCFVETNAVYRSIQRRSATTGESPLLHDLCRRRRRSLAYRLDRRDSNRRRSRAVSAPQMPYGSGAPRAWSRHLASTGQSRQIVFACSSRLISLRPRSSSGKNISEGSSRQLPCNCQLHCSNLAGGRLCGVRPPCGEKRCLPGSIVVVATGIRSLCA